MLLHVDKDFLFPEDVAESQLLHSHVNRGGQRKQSVPRNLLPSFVMLRHHVPDRIARQQSEHSLLLKVSLRDWTGR